MDIKTLSAPDLDNRATRYLRERPFGAWTLRTIGEAIRCSPPAVEAMLQPAIRQGLVEWRFAAPSQGGNRHFYWRDPAPTEHQPPDTAGQATEPAGIQAGSPAAGAPVRIEDGEEDSATEAPVIAPQACAHDWTATLLPGGAIELRAGPVALPLSRAQVRALVLCLDGEDLDHIRGGA